MEAACLRQTELPNTSKLFSDYLYHHDRVRPFYHIDGDRTWFPEERRPSLVAAIAEQNEGSPALKRLGEPGTVAFVTGQQVGLFSGPAYTIYKALTAAKMAEQSTKQGKPAVAIFWLATEDHDFAEVNHVWNFNAAHEPVRFEVRGDALPEQPAGEITVKEWPIEQLKATLRDLPFADEVLPLVEQAYIPGETMGRAFRKLVSALLKKYELLYVDPLCPKVRELAAPLMRKAVERAPDLKKLLLARNKELTDAGYHAQVHIEQKTSLFFVLDGHRRIALKRQNGDYASFDRRYSPQELADNSAHLSPNALLRPVVQDYLLPTAAYVGGPAELAYFAQSQVLYKELLGYMPRLRSRSGFTIFDARCTKLLNSYKLRVQDLFHGDEALREKMAGRLIPPALNEHFHAATESTNETIDKLFAEVNAFDPTLGATLQKSRAKILHQLCKTEGKVARETFRRNERAAADAQYLYNTIVPHKHLQERFYSILPLVAQHGLDLIDRVYEQVHLECPDHILLTM